MAAELRQAHAQYPQQVKMLRVMRLLAWAEIPALCTERQNLHHYRSAPKSLMSLFAMPRPRGIGGSLGGDSGMGGDEVEDREGGEGGVLPAKPTAVDQPSP